jgi:hypothetical protein
MENIYFDKKRNYLLIKTNVLIDCFIQVSRPSGKKETPNQRYSVGYMAPAAAFLESVPQSGGFHLEEPVPKDPWRRTG